MDYKRRLIAAAKYVYDGDSRVSEEARVVPSEFLVTAALKPHQVEGVSWLIRRYHLGVNVILGDEMGLGKTLQAISLLSYLKICQKSPGPFLVLCPLSVIDGWVSEVGKFAPKLRLLRYVGEKEHRRKLRGEMHEYVKELSLSSHVPTLPFDVLLTTYDIALIDQDFLSQFPWRYAVIDEAQRLKNPSSVLYNVLRERFVMPRKLLMTGTPIQNNITELWALMHFCMPLIFGTLEQFVSEFKEAGDPSCEDTEKVKEQFKILKYVLGAFMLRRTKSKLVESGTLSLPPVTKNRLVTVGSFIRMAPLSPLQKKVYVSILRKELPKLLALASGASNAQSLNNIVIQLRKACSHPYLFPGIEPEPYQEGEHLVQASGKLLILDQLLQRLHDSGHRVLLFAQMTHTLDILQDFLELRKYSYERLDGSIRAEERFAAIRRFSQNSVNKSASADAYISSPFVFLISTRAGGVGLNLMAADTVIFYEQDWNPQVDKQALQRAHRIGQSNHVLSINLVTGRTIEEVIMRRADRKLRLSHNVIGDDILQHEGGNIGGTEAGLAEKVIASRHELQSDVSDRKFEINPMNLMDGHDLVMQEGSQSIDFNPGLDEASYMSWVEKFKKASSVDDSGILESGNRRGSPDEKHLKAEASRKKAEEKKLSKWEALGYHSLCVSSPVTPANQDMMSDAGSVHFVYGDCTNTAAICPSEPTIIFSCVDNSGNWGHGGLFDALARLSATIPNAYERASEFGDLHLGDLHLIAVTDDHGLSSTSNAPQWVGLAVVQSYNPRRKVPHSSISIADLEVCLAKASFSAAKYSASIHETSSSYYQDGSDFGMVSVERPSQNIAAMDQILPVNSYTLNIVLEIPYWQLGSVSATGYDCPIITHIALYSIFQA
ncbi:putative helicase CHR10 [Sesamum alatum]|uniref:Helicase CHR10 n=1 Tax=Sesamum alatum TaxID=300844 RepID=A0AAE1XNK1_9LAMI|nr:putative helicase CHR10 [Sesamum alatum]